MTTRLENLQRQIDSLQAEMARVAAQPQDDFDDKAVLVFTKRYGDAVRSSTVRELTYVALKTAGRWYLSGRRGESTRMSGMTWEELVNFIGDFDQAEVWYATEWERV